MPVGLQVDTNCVFAIGNKIIRSASSKGTRAGDRFALHAFIDQLPRGLELQPPLRRLDFPLLAQMRSADRVARRPSVREKRKTSARADYFAF
jgi:hypothetical protein